MKRKLAGLMIIVIMSVCDLILPGSVAYAAEAHTGEQKNPQEQSDDYVVNVEFEVESETISFPMVIDMYFEDDEKEQFFVECAYNEGYITQMPMPIGHYQMTHYECFTHNEEQNLLDPVDYVIEVTPFTVKKEDGQNGAAKRVAVTATERAVYNALHSKQQETESNTSDYDDLSWLHDGSTEHNVEDPYHSTDQREIAYYTIPQDNKYFPGWTVIEIQSWYKDEVADFLKTDFCTSGDVLKIFNNGMHVGTNSEIRGKYPATATLQDAEYYYCQVEYRTTKNDLSYNAGGSRSFEKGWSSMDSDWVMNVYVFHPDETKTEETRRFCEAQDRIFSFIADYYLETGVQLNFSVWNYDDITEPVINIPDEKETVQDNEVVSTEKVKEEAVIATETDQEKTEHEPERKPIGKKILCLFSVTLLLILIVVGFYLAKKKDKD